jgi:nitrous oxide reductase accessory protein NosL
MGHIGNRPPIHRRRALQVIGLGVITGSTGCLGALQPDNRNSPDPIDLSGDKLDFYGGMKIGMHGGPNGQIFYKHNEPEPVGGTSSGSERQDDIAWFHTLVHGLFPYHFERMNRGWEAAAIYVTDYSATDWEVVERENNTYMPAPTASETFRDATGLSYVAESDVMGGMGPELHPFSDPDDASEFTDTHGGQIFSFNDINQRMIQGLQRAGEQ